MLRALEFTYIQKCIYFQHIGHLLRSTKKQIQRTTLLTFGFLNLERTFCKRSSNFQPREFRELSRVSACKPWLGCGSLRPRPIKSHFGQCQLSRLQAPPDDFQKCLHYCMTFGNMGILWLSFLTAWSYRQYAIDFCAARRSSYK